MAFPSSLTSTDSQPQPPIGTKTTVTISHDIYGITPVQPLTLTIATYSPFISYFSPLVHNLGFGQSGIAQVAPSAPPPAFGNMAGQVHQSRDLVKEWADERMAADLKYWGEVYETAEPKLSAELLAYHTQWQSLPASERAVVQEKLEDTKKKWLVSAKRA